MKYPIKILIVEDEVITAMLMQAQLRSLGCIISQHVTTGENAIVSARENPPDLILMDIVLAGEIDGIDAAAAIRSESDIPVIFVTGYEDQNNKVRAENVHPLDYLIKPFNINKLKILFDAHFK